MEKAVLPLKLLIEGSSVRTTERISGLHRGTICRLLLIAVEKCEKLRTEEIRNVLVRDERIPTPVIGNPHPDFICTLHIERQNLSRGCKYAD